MGAAKYSATRDKGLVDLRSPRNLNVLNFSRTSNGARYNSAGIMEQCTTGVARFDYDPMTVTKANYLKNSRLDGLILTSSTLCSPLQFTAGATGTSVPVPSTVYGGEIAFEQTATAERPFLSQTQAFLPGTYTLSFYVESASGVLVGEVIGAGAHPGIAVYRQNGATVLSSAAVVTGLIEITWTVSAASSTQIRIGIGCAGPATGTIRFSRPQLNRSSAALPHIHTGVTRRGKNVIVNGDFASGASNWNTSGADVTIGAGVATITGATHNLNQLTVVPTIGRAYEFFLKVTARTASTVRVGFGSLFINTPVPIGTTYLRVPMTCDFASGYYFRGNSVTDDFDVDDIEVREINTDFASPQGNGQLRGLLVEQSSTNLLLRSSEFDGVNWGRTNSTVTANQEVAPDGTLTADLVTTTGGGQIIQSATATSTACTFSVYVKKKGATSGFVQMYIRNQTTATNISWLTVDWATMTATAGSGISGVEPVGGGWYRFYLVATTGIAVGNTVTVYPTSHSAAGVEFYLWGAQLEPGEIPSAHIPTSAAMITRAIDAPKRQGGVAAIGYVDGPGTIYAEFAYAGRGSAATSGSRSAVSIDDGSAADRVGLYNASGGTAGLCQAASVTQAVPFIAGSVNQNTFIKVAMAFAAGDFQIAKGGTLSAVEAVGTLPNPSLVDVWIGRSFGNVLNGWVRKIHYTPRRLDATTLGKMTT